MTDQQEDGFEYQGVFYKWAVTDGAKDMLLIDRFTGLPIHEFFEQIEDGFDRGRAPILLASIATSVRARNPEWSVERISRMVLNLNLSDVTFLEADEAEETGETDGPPAVAAPMAADSTPDSSSESKPSVTLQVSSHSPTSVVTPD